MARRNLSAKQPAKNISAMPPTRQIMGADGVMITEKLCPIPHQRKMISPQGDAVAVALGTGFVSLRNDPHAIQKYEDKLKAGFLPFNECPLRSTHPSLANMKGTPCDPADLSDKKACKHLEVIAENRKNAHRRKENEFAAGMLTNADRQVRAMEELIKLNAAAPAKGKMGV